MRALMWYVECNPGTETVNQAMSSFSQAAFIVDSSNTYTPPFCAFPSRFLFRLFSPVLLALLLLLLNMKMWWWRPCPRGCA